MKIEITNAKVAIAVSIGIGLLILAINHPEALVTLLPGIVRTVVSRS